MTDVRFLVCMLLIKVADEALAIQECRSVYNSSN